jgi:hypothetical protein
MLCSFTKEVWKEVEGMIGMKNVWEGGNIEEAFRSWYSKKGYKEDQIPSPQHSLGSMAC